MDTVDEYRWYLCDADYITSQTYLPNHKQCVELTKKRLTLANVLKYHPRMGWNSRGAEGLTHLQAGVWAVSKNRVLNVLHYYETKLVLDNDKRSISNVERMNAKVESDRYFGTQEEDKWKEGLVDCD